MIVVKNKQELAFEYTSSKERDEHMLDMAKLGWKLVRLDEVIKTFGSPFTDEDYTYALFAEFTKESF